METKDVKVGMKVVPHHKTYSDNCTAEEFFDDQSSDCCKKQFRDTGFLTVTRIDQGGEPRFFLSCGKCPGWVFFACDFSPAAISVGDVVKVTKDKHRRSGKIVGFECTVAAIHYSYEPKIFMLKCADNQFDAQECHFESDELDLVRKAKKPAEQPEQKKEEPQLFNVGDRVSVEGKGEGIIIGSKENRFLHLVEFDNKVRCGHDGRTSEADIGRNTGKDGHCWWTRAECLKLISKKEDPTMSNTRIVMVKHPNSCKSFMFSVPDSVELTVGDKVLCDTCRGEAVGTVEKPVVPVNAEALPMLCSAYGATLPLKSIIGKYTETVERFKAEDKPKDTRYLPKYGEYVKVLRGMPEKYNGTFGTVEDAVISVNNSRGCVAGIRCDDGHYCAAYEVEPAERKPQFKVGDWIEVIKEDGEFKVGFKTQILSCKNAYSGVKGIDHQARTPRGNIHWIANDRFKPCTAPSPVVITREQAKAELKAKYGERVSISMDGKAIDL